MKKQKFLQKKGKWSSKSAKELTKALIQDVGILPIIQALYETVIDYEKNERADDESISTKRQAKMVDDKLTRIIDWVNYHAEW